MSREDLPFLTGLVAIPIWTFVALPLSYGDVPMGTMVEFVYFVSGVLIGGVIIFFFYRRSGQDLRREAEKLRE
jgi:uncharacterized membrane protein YdjX (TVP38/TMEM64 family)